MATELIKNADGCFPCPFTGKYPIVVHNGDQGPDDMWSVIYEDYTYCIWIEAKTPEEAIEIWNKRV